MTWSARDDVRGDLMRARHRLSKLLLRREIVCPGPGGAWTQAHMAWLVQRRATLDTAVAELIADSPYAATVPVLRCFRGIDTLSAAGLCAEIGDFARFAHPKRLAGFLGIVPCEHTSDDHRRQGAITKAGPAHSRRLLVEAAHHYRRRPHVGVALQRRQAGQDPRVCAVAWRAQQRLHRQWQRLHGRRRKPPTVVAVAVARELSALLWEAATID